MVERGGKSRITIRVDNATLAVFKARAEMSGGNYQRARSASCPRSG
jgi:predicted DNA binding CopG/RHH family protein